MPAQLSRRALDPVSPIRTTIVGTSSTRRELGEPGLNGEISPQCGVYCDHARPRLVFVVSRDPAYSGESREKPMNSLRCSQGGPLSYGFICLPEIFDPRQQVHRKVGPLTRASLAGRRQTCQLRSLSQRYLKSPASQHCSQDHEKAWSAEGGEITEVTLPRTQDRPRRSYCRDTRV